MRPFTLSHDLIRRVTDEIENLPGVRSAAFTTGVPLTGNWTRIYTIEGQPEN
jgi:hypothetical protein